MELKPVALKAAAESLTEQWSPRVVARINDQYVKVARVQGDFVWHAHEHEDEAFLVLAGQLRILFEDGQVTLGPGDLHVVPKGVRHKPEADEECLIALIEPVATLHTGDVVDQRTRTIDEQLGA